MEHLDPHRSPIAGMGPESGRCRCRRWPCRAWPRVWRRTGDDGRVAGPGRQDGLGAKVRRRRRRSVRSAQRGAPQPWSHPAAAGASRGRPARTPAPGTARRRPTSVSGRGTAAQGRVEFLARRRAHRLRLAGHLARAHQRARTVLAAHEAGHGGTAERCGRRERRTRCRSRSSIKSWACSMPTDRRSRSGRRRRAGAFDAGAVLDQAFGAAQRGRAFPQRHPGGGRHGCSPPAGHADRQHAAEAARIWRTAAAWPCAAGRPGYSTSATSGWPSKVLGDALRRRAGRTHAQVQRAHAAQQQPGFERTQRAADLGAHLADALPQGVVRACHQHAGDQVASGR
jgi:hypothetical protein